MKAVQVQRTQWKILKNIKTQAVKKRWNTLPNYIARD